MAKGIKGFPDYKITKEGNVVDRETDEIVLPVNGVYILRTPDCKHPTEVRAKALGALEVDVNEKKAEKEEPKPAKKKAAKKKASKKE